MIGTAVESFMSGLLLLYIKKLRMDVTIFSYALASCHIFLGGNFELCFLFQT